MMEEVQGDNSRYQNKKIKQNLEAPENFEFLVSPMSDHCYCKSFTFLALHSASTQFEIFVITLHKKWRISGGFGHIYWNNP